MNDCLTTLTCVYLHRNTEIVGVGSHLMTPSRPLPDNAWRDREREREREGPLRKDIRAARAVPSRLPARLALPLWPRAAEGEVGGGTLSRLADP